MQMANRRGGRRRSGGTPLQPVPVQSWLHSTRASGATRCSGSQIYSRTRGAHSVKCAVHAKLSFLAMESVPTTVPAVVQNVVSPAPPRGVQPSIQIGADIYPVSEWSVTVAVRGNNVPESWLTRMKHYAVAKCIAGAFALEAGGRQQRLHVQGVMRLRLETTTLAISVLKEDIKRFVPIQRGSGGTVAVNPLQEGQTWTYMLGYVQKDEGTAHYRLEVHQVSQEDLRAGVVAYGGVRNDPEEGRIVINKGNLPKLLKRFYSTHLTPMEDMPVDHVLKYMLRTDCYIPSAQWAMARSGCGLSKTKLQAMWDLLVKGLHNASILHVRRVFFDDDREDLQDALWTASLQEVLAEARRLRQEPQHQRQHNGLRDLLETPQQETPPPPNPNDTAQRNRIQRLLDESDAYYIAQQAEMRHVRRRLLVDDDSSVDGSITV